MQKLFMIAMDEDGTEVQLLDPETDAVLYAQTILPDVDGDEVAIKTAAMQAIRDAEIDL